MNVLRRVERACLAAQDGQRRPEEVLPALLHDQLDGLAIAGARSSNSRSIRTLRWAGLYN